MDWIPLCCRVCNDVIRLPIIWNHWDLVQHPTIRQLREELILRNYNGIGRNLHHQFITELCVCIDGVSVGLEILSEGARTLQ